MPRNFSRDNEYASAQATPEETQRREALRRADDCRGLASRYATHQNIETVSVEALIVAAEHAVDSARQYDAIGKHSDKADEARHFARKCIAESERRALLQRRAG